MNPAFVLSVMKREFCLMYCLKREDECHSLASISKSLLSEDVNTLSMS